MGAGIGKITGGSGGINPSAGGGGPSGASAETSNNVTANFAPRNAGLDVRTLAVIGVAIVGALIVLRRK